MSEVVITALIAGLCSAVPSIMTTLSTSRKNNDLVMYQINELKDKVNKHNNLIDRMYKVENRVTLIEDEIKKGA